MPPQSLLCFGAASAGPDGSEDMGGGFDLHINIEMKAVQLTHGHL